MQEKEHDFPNGLEAIFIILAVFMAEYVVGGLMYDARSLLDLNSNEAGVLITLLGNGVVFTAVMHFKHLSYRNLFHENKAKASHTFFLLLPPILLLTPALVLSMSAVSSVIRHLFPLPDGSVATFDDISSAKFAMVIAACIMAPILEEMLFRGVILRSFLKQYPRWRAIIASALLFGIAHMNIYQFVVASLGGIALGWLYERTDSLLPSMTLHATYNSSLTLFAPSGNEPSQIETSTVTVWIIAAILAAFGLQYLKRAISIRLASPKK